MKRLRSGFANFSLLVSGALLFLCGAGSLSFADWQFGQQRLIRNAERTQNYLQVPPGGRHSLRTFRFVSRVGGVALEIEAELPDGFDPASAKLIFDSAASDGERAALMFKGTRFAFRLYDWELKPIVQFADSQYASVVSLFGEGPSKRSRYIDYHPAFLDTLLGMRLLQADIILMSPEKFSDLPTHKGVRILGPGERISSTDVQLQATTRLAEIMRKHDSIASWVLTDVDQKALVKLDSERVIITVSPYYYFWRPQVLTPEESRQLMVWRLEILARKRQNLPTFDLEAKVRELASAVRGRTPAVLPVEEATKELAQNSKLLEDANPAVFDAVIKTSGHAAFFRAFKKRNPQGWTLFVAQVSKIELPSVETPNEWPRD